MNYGSLSDYLPQSKSLWLLPALSLSKVRGCLQLTLLTCLSSSLPFGQPALCLVTQQAASEQCGSGTACYVPVSCAPHQLSPSCAQPCYPALQDPCCPVLHHPSSASFSCSCCWQGMPGPAWLLGQARLRFRGGGGSWKQSLRGNTPKYSFVKSSWGSACQNVPLGIVACIHSSVNLCSLTLSWLRSTLAGTLQSAEFNNSAPSFHLLLMPRIYSVPRIIPISSLLLLPP